MDGAGEGIGADGTGDQDPGGVPDASVVHPDCLMSAAGSRDPPFQGFGGFAPITNPRDSGSSCSGPVESGYPHIPSGLVW